MRIAVGLAHQLGKGENVSEIDRRFETLSKALAHGHSRRGVLKLGAAVIGAAAASAFSGRAWAADPGGGGNSDCAHFCNTVFPPGPERGACKSAAAHGQGLCAQCQADVLQLCPPVVGRVCCDLTAGELCCPTQGRCLRCPPGEIPDLINCTCSQCPTEGEPCGANLPPCCLGLKCTPDIGGQFSCTAGTA